MAEAPLTFSESWYRIAAQRLALRSQVRVRRQYFRGERWYVLHDPFTNQFYRLRPAAYEFVVRLRPDRTVDAVWNECFDLDPENAPGQEESLNLLAQLHAANLLHSPESPDTTQLFERFKKHRQREKRGYLLNIMFARIPLLDPDAFLRRSLPLARAVFSRFGFLVWLGVVLAAIKVAVDDYDGLRNQANGLLAPGNLIWLYAALVLVKTVHEFGHAFACRRFGGEVHTMGVMLLLFTPVPYMDATASWSFRSRWQRAIVGMAGMYVELFVAACATFVWAATGPGVLHSVAYNMMFVASVSTVIFNANPLLRFDGYYVLSDLLDVPNLHQRSVALLRHLVEYHAFGWKKSRSPAHTRREAGWLGGFAVASGVYRIVVFSAILLFIADEFLIFGLLMAVVCAGVWVVRPLFRLVVYLASSPRLERTRLRATAITLGAATVLLGVLEFVPAPNWFRAPGVLQARSLSVVAVPVAGEVSEILVPDGANVTKGQPLFRLVNRDLELNLWSALAQLDETEALRRRAMKQSTADLAPLAARAGAIQRLVAKLEQDRNALVVVAPQAGVWSAPGLKDMRGAWVDRGWSAGQVIDGSQFYFSAIVSQNEASRLFTDAIRGSAVKLHGQAELALPVTERKVIPVDRKNLPSAALGWGAGGELAVDVRDGSGLHAKEAFFEVRAEVQAVESAVMLHGRGGRIQFRLEAEPLLRQWARGLRQVLQNRYGL